MMSTEERKLYNKNYYEKNKEKRQSNEELKEKRKITNKKYYEKNRFEKQLVKLKAMLFDTTMRELDLKDEDILILDKDVINFYFTN